jgi:subtilisin family serine protease
VTLMGTERMSQVRNLHESSHISISLFLSPQVVTSVPLFFLPRDLKIYFSHLVHVCACYSISILGTVGSKAFGIAKKANLIAVKVLDSNGDGTTDTAIAGIDWVVAQERPNGAVINISLGSPLNYAFNSAVEKAVAAGITVVVAAGNARSDACRVSPASAANAITVGSTDQNDRKGFLSNIGTCLDIFAPGVGITSLYNSQGLASIKSGTSMASPHVAGVAALLLQENRFLTPADITGRIRADATRGVVANAGRGSPNFLLFTGKITPLSPTLPPVPTTPAVTTQPTPAPVDPVSALIDPAVPAPGATGSCGTKFAPCNLASECCSNTCKNNGMCG